MVQADLLQAADCSDVAALHLAYLHTPFSGRPGAELLARYYRAVTSQVGACGYAFKEKGKALGFVCGVWNPQALQRELLWRDWCGLGTWAMLQVLAKPRLMLDFLYRIRPSRTETEKLDKGYELRPIVVASTARGSGVAIRLLNALLNDAAQRGFERIFLYTEEDNLAARAFYRKTGFEQLGRRMRHGSIQLRYERTTEP